MQLRLLLLAIALLAALASPMASAAGPQDATPGNRWVDATFTLTQPDLRTLNLVGSLVFYEYDVDGARYTADDMGEAYVNANTFTRGPAKGNELVTKVEAQARASLETTLAAAFPTATREITRVELDRSTLQVTGGNDFDPGVVINVAATIARTNADLGLGDYSDAAIEAVFDAGASVTTSFILSSQPGYKTVYSIAAPAAPAGLVFADIDAEGASLADGGRLLETTLDNTGGTSAMNREIGVTLRDPSASAPTAEDIRTRVAIGLGELKAGVASIPIQTSVEAEIRAVDLAERFPGILPEKVSLAYLSADAMRALRATGVIGDDELASADDALLGAIRDDLGAALNSEVTVVGGLARDDLAQAAGTPFSTEPPVGFAATATGAYPLESEGAENLDLALRIGAKVTFDLNLFASRTQDSVFTLTPPPGTRFLAAQGGELAADGGSATFEVPAAPEGSTAFPVTLSMSQVGAPTYSAEKADLSVIVDLKDLDVTLGGVAGGDFGDLVVDVTVTGALGILKVPDDLKASFDERLELSYLSSDAMRLLRQRGILDDARLSELEQKLLDEVRNNLGSALGATVEVTGGIDRATLDPSLVSATLSGDTPVVFKATTSFRKSLSGEPAPQAAIALYTQQQSFTLPKVQGLDTAYTVILPKGLAVTALQAEGGSYETGKAADGRDQFTVRPTDGQATATVSMAVTPAFVMAKFWPVVLLAALVLVLLVGSPVALVVMRRRKKAAAGKK